MVRCGSDLAQRPKVRARVTRARAGELLLLSGLLSLTNIVLATTASVAASDGPDKDEGEEKPDFLMVVVPVAEGSQAELHLRNGDRLDIKVRLLAAEYELDPEELYRKVHKQLVRERVLPMVEVDAGEGLPPLPIFTADIIEQVVERYGEEHGLDDEGVEALLEATHRHLNARIPGTLPPLPPGYRLPAPAVSAVSAAAAAAIVPTEVDAAPTSTSDTTSYVHPPQPPPSAMSRPQSVLETQAAAAAAPAAASREVDRSAPAYELIVTVWGQPQRLVLYEGEMLAEAVYTFAASHKMPFTDTELLMTRVKHMLDARAAATTADQQASDAAAASAEVDGSGSIPVTVDGRLLHMELRPGQTAENAVDEFLQTHALAVSVRSALLSAVHTRTQRAAAPSVTQSPLKEAATTGGLFGAVGLWGSWGGESQPLQGAAAGEARETGAGGLGGERVASEAVRASERVAVKAMELDVDLDGEAVALRVAAGQSASAAVESFMRTHALQESMRAPLSDAVLQVMQSTPATDATCAD